MFFFTIDDKCYKCFPQNTQSIKCIQFNIHFLSTKAKLTPSALSGLRRLSTMPVNTFTLIKHFSVLSITTLVVVCVFYLVTAVQLFQRILEQLSRAQQLEDQSPGVPLLTMQARHTLERNETALTHQIVVFSTTAVVSLLGLVATVRQCLPLVLAYAIALKAIFVANFFLPSRLRPFVMVLMALVVIGSFSFAYVVRRRHTSASLSVNLPEVYYSKTTTTQSKKC